MTVERKILSHPRYEAGPILGRGGQGVVLRVVDRENPHRELVAKIWADAASGQAIAGEFALLSRSRIPGLVRAHDLARDERTGAPFLVEDYVEGADAAEWIEGEQESNRSERLGTLLAEVGTTLAALHDVGFVHGDMKPAHVRVTAARRAMVLDLGSAVMRGHSDLTGNTGTPRDIPWAVTRGFAAPEVQAGARPSPLSDLYSLGALAWKCCTGRAPDRRQSLALRDVAPWVFPKLAEAIEHLLAPHPSDRPGGARELLRLLGSSGVPGPFTGDSRFAPLGRERTFDDLLVASSERVRYLVGPSGIGKSHLARALVTAALLRGRPARLLAFGDDHHAPLDDLLAFLRGDPSRSPFREQMSEVPLLLVLDDLHRAPLELVAALDLYRCRVDSPRMLDVIAAAREAPSGACTTELEPFDDEQMTALVRELGVSDPTTIDELLRSAVGIPGFAVAWLGRIPLTRAAVVDRVKSLSPAAVEALAAVAVAGGSLSDGIFRAVMGENSDLALGELFGGALLTRAALPHPSYALTAPHAVAELASAIGDFEIVDRVAAVVLESPSATTASLVALAHAQNPASRRTELLHRGVARAREQGLREAEMDLCFALAADASERTPDLLLRLERLTRDTGRVGLHPQVLAWLDEVGTRDAKIAPLAWRRSAEAKARAGQHTAAADLAQRAVASAVDQGDTAGEALARATLGVVALYRAEWIEAERALSRARRLMPPDYPDQEERARLEHNFGVVALYRGRAAEAREAFVRSLGMKRELGDRSGVRACLLNLGLALAKLGRLDEADGALREAVLLAEALGQTGGLAWCLAARADVEVRRKNATAAERWIAEARALGEAIPAAVRADLILLSASVRLLEGDGCLALAALDDLDARLREEDPLVDARAMVAEARAYLASVPAPRRRAARAAIRALRRARAAHLPEAEEEAASVLRAARSGRAATRAAKRYHGAMTTEAQPAAEDALWAWLRSSGGDIPVSDAGFELARLSVQQGQAERGFVALFDASGEVAVAWGADIDGLPIAEALQRLPMDELRIALRKPNAVYFRDLTTPLGAGSRLAVASGEAKLRAVVVLEHRTRHDCFDGLPAHLPTRWATLAGLLARIYREVPPHADDAVTAVGASERSALSVPRAEDSTTSFPLRKPRRSFPGILGKADSLQRALAQLDTAIDSDLPVLIVGETGTGKELFARALHEMGPRARFPFLAVNCGAVPESLFEAEFFGHARGSFTGADRARPGLLSRAERGTLLLDEVGELPPSRQASLLRAVETHKFRPVGSDEERSFHVRIVAATHRDLGRAVEEGRFRRDLLFRLNVIEIRVPPLRDREGDIAALAGHFLEKAGSSAQLSKRALEALSSYSWPGNVRELEHHMQRLAALSPDVIEREMLPREIRAAARGSQRRTAPRNPEQERREVERALASAGGNISHAAERLGVTRHGLKKRMVRLGMRKAGKR